MWKAAVGSNIAPSTLSCQDDDDDWDTDPNYVNNVTEEEQRWGGKARTAGAIDMSALREQTTKEHSELKKKSTSQGPQASYGYGGKFGLEQDR